MPFIPHTDQDIEQMLSAIGIDDIQALFKEIPPQLLHCDLSDIPEGMSEAELTRLLKQRLCENLPLNFIGAGAYEHHIPAAVWEVASRGEFLTAYTPYQAEASQGSLQLIYEFQTMMAGLTGMEVSNASLYDGASALAEAVLMAVRLSRGQKKKILIPRTTHPAYRQTVQTIVSAQNIELIELPFSLTTGIIDPTNLKDYEQDDNCALIIPYPNFFGHLEEVDTLTRWAHQQKLLVIACANPLALALLKEPGAWGDTGADIVCGEGQPLGVPLAYGGPYFGFLCCRQQFVRQLPGRLVGRSVDTNGNTAFTLTLQAREQHIRRSKATSNICTNQGLLVTAATIYMSLLGPEGLKQVAASCHHLCQRLITSLKTISGVTVLFDSPYFHESIITLPIPVTSVLNELRVYGIDGGYDLGDDYPELGNSLLLCVTETKTETDLQQYSKALNTILTKQQVIDKTSAQVYVAE